MFYTFKASSSAVTTCLCLSEQLAHVVITKLPVNVYTTILLLNIL